MTSSILASTTQQKVHTGCFLLTIASNSANDGIFLPTETVFSAFSVSLCPSSGVLGLAGSVLLSARVRPRLRTGHITESLNDGALERVELAGGFTVIGGMSGAHIQ